MAKQLYYEDVEVGIEIPPLVKRPTTRQLVQWAGASGDYYELHYDKDFAQAQGFPNVLVHGKLKFGLLGQMLTDWIGEGGILRKLSCSYRGTDFPGEDLVCKGRVANKYVKDGEHIVECEIWTENPGGEKTTPGNATVILPSRAQDKKEA
ncbi:MAG: acyl dehydratase [Dehalococcoidia bacterium]|nr:MAG: acyl dehydratase [Dehalococcoidia bacterium]